MAGKTYDEEFRRQAVDLLEATPGVSARSIAADLGISRETLRVWVRAYGSPKRTAPASEASTAPAAAQSPAERIAWLEAENASLRAETRKLSTERDILRTAAKYFAGETRW